MPDEGNWWSNKPLDHALVRAFKKLTLTCTVEHNHELECYLGEPGDIANARYCLAKLKASTAGFDRIVHAPHGDFRR